MMTAALRIFVVCLLVMLSTTIAHTQVKPLLDSSEPQSRFASNTKTAKKNVNAAVKYATSLSDDSSINPFLVNSKNFSNGSLFREVGLPGNISSDEIFINWKLVTIIVILFNGSLGAMALLVFIFWKRRRFHFSTEHNQIEDTN